MEKRNIIKKGNETKYYIYVCTTTKKPNRKQHARENKF